MGLSALHGPDALFEGEETLVDLCSLQSPLSGVRLGVLGSLGAGQITQNEFPLEYSLLSHVYLTDSM